MKVYLAGPMRGVPHFNHPAFHAAAARLRAAGHEVFNPAEKDHELYGGDISKNNPTGSEQVAIEQHGFNIGNVLCLDLSWICKNADAIALLPGWENSKGARAEKATADALALQTIYDP